jgi:hypothetical protein
MDADVGRFFAQRGGEGGGFVEVLRVLRGFSIVAI